MWLIAFCSDHPRLIIVSRWSKTTSAVLQKIAKAIPLQVLNNDTLAHDHEPLLMVFLQILTLR